MRKYRRVAFLLLIALVDAAVIYYGVHLRDHPQTAVSPPAVIIPLPPSATPALPEVKLDRQAQHVDAAEPVPVPLIAAWSDRDVWRTLGYCAQINTLIGTINSGSGWFTPSQPAAYILGMHRTGDRSGWVLGSDTSCTTLAKFVTTDAGAHWRRTKNVGKQWVLTPVGPRRPNGALTYPCGKNLPAPISFASAGPAGDAIAICAHRVVRTTDRGKSWQPVGDLSPGKAAGIALTSDGTGALVMTEEPTCEGGRVLNTVDAGASWTAGECLRVVKSPVAMSIGDGGGGMLLSLGSRYLTTDFGKSWS